MDYYWLMASVGFLLGMVVGGGLLPVWQRYARGPTHGSPSTRTDESTPDRDRSAQNVNQEADNAKAAETDLVLSSSSRRAANGNAAAPGTASSLPVYLRDPLQVLRGTFRYDDVGAAFDGNGRPYTFRMVSDFMEPEIPRHAQVLATPTDQFRDDAVYAFRLGETFYIARVMRLPDWHLRVLPANDAYRPFTLSLRTADIAVLGRVFAVVL